MSKADLGAVVPIPTFPAEVTMKGSGLVNWVPTYVGLIWNNWDVEVQPMPMFPLRNTAPGVSLEAKPAPQRWRGAMGEVVPIPTFNPEAMTNAPPAEVVPMATFPWTANPLFKEAGKVEKANDEPIPTEPNTPKVAPGADPPIPSLIKPLFQKKGLTPVMEDPPSQKAIWPLAVEEPDTPDPPASA